MKRPANVEVSTEITYGGPVPVVKLLITDAPHSQHDSQFVCFHDVQDIRELFRQLEWSRAILEKHGILDDKEGL